MRTQPTRPGRVSPVAAYAIVRLAVEDGDVAWVACPCGCGLPVLRTVGAKGIRASGGCARVIGEA